MPVLPTEITARPPVLAVEISTRPPATLCRSALSSRLATRLSASLGSPAAGAVASVASTRMPRRSASACRAAYPGPWAGAAAAAGSVLYLALIGVLTLGTAAAVRDPAAAIGVVLGLLYLFPIATAAVSDPHWHRLLEQVVPMSAGLAIQATTGLRSLPIGPWAGLGVLAAWAFAALLAGGLRLAFGDA